MRLIPNYVVSSNIDCLAFECDALYIRFKHGGTYRYDGVAFGVFDAMMKDESVGKAFHALIKNKYPFVKLDTDPFKE